MPQFPHPQYMVEGLGDETPGGPVPGPPSLLNL